MAEQKGWGKTVAGWFIVDETDRSANAPPAGKAPAGKAPSAAPPPAADDATDDIIRRYSGGGGGKGKPAATPAKPAGKPDTAPARSPSGEAPPDFGGGRTGMPATAAGAGGAAPEMGADGAIDFKGVFTKAGITEQEADRVARALTLLSQLPKETPAPIKKQIVEAALNSFGVPIESIIESAVAEIEALHACIQSGSTATQTLLSQSMTRIDDLQRQVAEVQEVMTARQAEQKSLEQQARAEGLKVQQILEFFGEEVVGKVVKDSPRLHEPDAK